MALYRFSAQIISRGNGGNAVAAAAYRAREKITQKETRFNPHKTHNYSNKDDLYKAEILAPKHAPTWAKIRSIVWNTVERVETRKNSQLSREFVIALPRELTNEQNWKLITEFVEDELVSLGMIADIAFHQSSKNPHAHVMLTTREITPKGFGEKCRDWNKKELLLHLRKAWEIHANRALELAGHDVRIDCRSNEDQESDRVYQKKGWKPKVLKPRSKLAKTRWAEKRKERRKVSSPALKLRQRYKPRSRIKDCTKLVDKSPQDIDISRITREVLEIRSDRPPIDPVVLTILNQDKER